MAPVLEDELGDILPKARDGKAWSANDLAEAVAIPVSDIRRMEQYELIPDDAAIQKLAEALDLHGPALKAIFIPTTCPICSADTHSTVPQRKDGPPYISMGHWKQ